MSLWCMNSIEFSWWCVGQSQSIYGACGWLNHVLSMCWSLWGLSPILGRRRFLAVHSSLRLSAGASGIFLPRAVRKNVHIQMRSNMVHGLVCKHLLIICKLLSTKSDNKLQTRRYSCIGARVKNVLYSGLTSLYGCSQAKNHTGLTAPGRESPLALTGPRIKFNSFIDFQRMSFHWKVCMAPRWRRVSEALSSGLAYAALYVFCLAKLILHLSRLVIGWSCQAEFTRRNASNGGDLGVQLSVFVYFLGTCLTPVFPVEGTGRNGRHTHTQTKGNYRQGQASILTDDELMQNI